MAVGHASLEYGASDLAVPARTFCSAEAAEAAAAVAETNEYGLYDHSGQRLLGELKDSVEHCEAVEQGVVTPSARASDSWALALATASA